MLNVNTIEFNGEKAIINSYSDHPALIKSMNAQREAWASACPNAIVITERMTEETVIEMVKQNNDQHRNYAHKIADASKKM